MYNKAINTGLTVSLDLPSQSPTLGVVGVRRLASSSYSGRANDAHRQRANC